MCQREKEIERQKETEAEAEIETDRDLLIGLHPGELLALVRQGAKLLLPLVVENAHVKLQRAAGALLVAGAASLQPKKEKKNYQFFSLFFSLIMRLKMFLYTFFCLSFYPFIFCLITYFCFCLQLTQIIQFVSQSIFHICIPKYIYGFGY